MPLITETSSEKWLNSVGRLTAVSGNKNQPPVNKRSHSDDIYISEINTVFTVSSVLEGQPTSS